LILGVMGMGRPLLAENGSGSASMSVEDFKELSAADQKSLLASVFERRLEHAKNIAYESVSRIRNYEYHDGVIGNPVNAGRGDGYRHWRLGNSYRMDYSDRIDHEQSATWSDGGLRLFASSHFNASVGVVRGIARNANSKQVYGRIAGPALTNSCFL
jgi:hypothetical protein